ncbi:MAG: hypothetical protein Q9210_004548 [Variospora velana]
MLGWGEPIALFILAAPIDQLVDLQTSSPSFLASAPGKDGWYRRIQWLALDFIIEGPVTVILAVGSMFFIADWPETAKFLTQEEGAVIIYFGCANNGYGGAFFTPSILKQMGRTSTKAQLYSIPIYALSAVVTVEIAFLSDRLRHRYAFCIVGILINVAGYGILLARTTCFSECTTGLGNLGGVVASNIYAMDEAPTYKTGFGTSLALSYLTGIL